MSRLYFATRLAFAAAAPDTDYIHYGPTAWETTVVNLYARIGAVSYVLWGLLHIQAARLVFMLGQTLEPGMVQGRIYQDAWNLFVFAVFGIVVAIMFNWKNDRFGYWLNLIVVSAADIGFIVLILVPGYAPWMPGALGPLLWIIAVIFSTLGILQSPRGTTGT